MYAGTLFRRMFTDRRTRSEQKGDIFLRFPFEMAACGKSTVKLTTYASYEMMATRIIIPYFETLNIKLKELTTEDIQEFYSAQLERVSANTVIHYHAVIHRALKYAVKIKTIQSNPAVNVERPRKEKFIGSFYDKKEINTLFDIIQGHPLEVAIKLAAFYGLRREEIIGLKWTAIDFENNTLTIQHTVTECNLDGKHIEVASDTAKTDSSLRTMPLVTNFREMLLAKKEKQEHYRKLCGRSYCKEYLDYIFVNEMGERWKPRYLSDGFKRILEQNGLRRIRFHDLRHTCASLLLANNVPMKKIQEWLGHSDFSTTANIYAHLDYQSKISSAEAMLTGLGMS